MTPKNALTLLASACLATCLAGCATSDGPAAIDPRAPGIRVTLPDAPADVGPWANSNTTRLETLIGKVDLRTERYLSREELDTRFATYGQRRDDLQRLTDARIERVERDIDGVQKQLVPRGEHEQMWAAQRARDADLQRQTNVNRKDLSDLHTPPRHDSGDPATARRVAP